MSTADQPTPQPPPKKGWFGRNWLWFVPTIILLPILVCGGCFGGLFVFGINQIKGSEPYQDALARAQADATVIERLGEPVEDATFIPQWNVSGDGTGTSGNSSGYIVLKGPKDTANARVNARMTDGNWEIIELEVTFSDGERIDLVRDNPDEGAALEGAPRFNPDETDETEI